MNLVLCVFGRPTKGIYLGIVYLSWTKYFIFCFFLSIMQILIRQIIIDFFSIENNRILLWKRPKVLMLKIPLLRFIIQPSNLLIFEVFLGMIFIWVNIHIFYFLRNTSYIQIYFEIVCNLTAVIYIALRLPVFCLGTHIHNLFVF